MSWVHLTAVGGIWYDDTENLGGKLMERTMRKMRPLFVAAVIALTGAAWAYTTSTSTYSSTSSSGTRTYTETTSTSLSREESASTYGGVRIIRSGSDYEYDSAYAQLQSLCAVAFDANGGVCAEAVRYVDRGDAVGTLPVATREGWTFTGWFTGKDSGVMIHASTAVKETVVYYAHWRSNNGYGSDVDADKWYTSRSAAVEAARRSRKKIFLIAGRSMCYNATTTKLACESLNVKSELTAKCVLWYSDIDTQASENADYLPLSDFELPVVCVIDPQDPYHYIKRTTGGEYGGALSGVDILLFIADIPYPPVPEHTASSSSTTGLYPNTGGATSQYANTRKLYGAVYDGDDVVGIVELKLGKVGGRTNTGKVSGAVTLLDGKKCAIKSQQAAVGGTAPISLEVRNVGTMDVTVEGDQFWGTLGGWRVQSANVGGNWGRSGVTVSVGAGDLSTIPGTVIDSLLPNDERGSSSSSKWMFEKAASVRWTRPKSGESPVVLDAETGKGLIVDTSKGRTNLSAMNLVYTPKNGTFKGSFKVYALEGSGKFTKLKKYTVKVSGVVVNGIGYGSATCKRPEINWSITVW